uniref:Uncharacterized protein n=1 Tax=Romanomermis culicivorax TaxID=13658 RepID=A0A915JXZ1_ROMCU
ELITTLIISDVFPRSSLLTAFSSPAFLNEFKDGVLLPVDQVVGDIKVGKFNPLIFALNPYLSRYTLRLPQTIRLVTPSNVPDGVLDRLPQPVSYVAVLLNFLALDTEIISRRQIKRLAYLLPELCPA